MLDNYSEHKAEVSALMQRLANIAGGLGMSSLKVDIEGVRLPKLAEERFNLVVLGEFNHGKSTLVNALLGKGLLPMGITPTTATINHIVWAEQPRARAILDDGTTKTLAPEQLADYVTIDGEHREGIRFVELGYPVELLRERITLVDTPGVNDINEARAEITYGYIPRADAVLFLLDCTQVLKQSERVFLQQRLLRRSRDKLIFVVCKSDLLRGDELEEAMDFARVNLAKIIADPVIFAVSARKYLEGEPDGSGMEPLLGYLRRYLEEERGRILVDNAVTDAIRTSDYLRSSVGLKRGSLELTLEELTARIESVRRQLEGSRQNLRDLVDRISAEREAIKATARHDLRQFTEAFCEALPTQIDKVSGADVKKYLSPFIQDRFKEFAEDEGDKIAELLEDLAEEIIQVTNENVHKVLETAAGGLGPADTRIDLHVDTLKYDAGVFALGALGTTVFLFVNTFVGGLLTLAAPVLAVVLRERVGGRIKVQAKKNAPEVVRSASEAIRPRFEACVDDFCDKLADFVASAGETLHRGISEVLDKTLAERSAHQDDVGVLAGELEHNERALAAVISELEDLRGRLWHGDPTPAEAAAAAQREAAS
ncbi:MAG: dynamin family protein [Myxococcales bacterium]|nr:dynamin family protein [Myxococcales bacterium]